MLTTAININIKRRSSKTTDHEKNKALRQAQAVQTATA